MSDLRGLGLGVDIPARSTPTARTASTSAVRTNPISLRLWKVISSSSNGGFDDPSSHEALEIISERYCGVKKTEKDEAKGRRRKRRDAGAHWLGTEAVKRAGLSDDTNGAQEAATAGEEKDVYWSSDSESELSEDASVVSDLSGTPASSVRPGILSRNQSSTTSIRFVTHPDAGGVAVGATNARKYFKRDLEAGLVEGSLRFLKAFEKVDDVSPRQPADLSY